jgi:hypothetical protein
MGRIILNDGQPSLQTTTTTDKKTGFISDSDWLKKRSKKYVEFFSKLDQHSLTDTKGWNELMGLIKEEFGAAELATLPLGIVSKCFIGHPYEVHILDLGTHHIVQHFKIDEPMPGEFEKARTLAKHNAYALIEVYTDKLILFREDGTAIKL